MLLYGCEVWSVRPVDMRSVDVAWNNSFRKIFNACSVGGKVYIQFYCLCLPASLLVYQRRVIIWLEMLNSNNLTLHTLANCCKDITVSLAHLRNTESTVSSISFLRLKTLNIWSKNIFGNILAAIICRCLIEFYFCVLLSFLVYLYVCIFCSVAVLLLRRIK